MDQSRWLWAKLTNVLGSERETKQSPATAVKQAWDCPWYLVLPYEDLRFSGFRLLLLLSCFGKRDGTIQWVISPQQIFFHFIPSQHLFVKLKASEGFRLK